MAAAGVFFVTVCVIRGYHVNKEVWSSSTGEAFVFIKHGGEINGKITLPLPKLEVFPNFRDGQYIKFLEWVEARSLEVCEL